MKNYKEFEMEIVLFRGDAWMDVVTSGNYDLPVIQKAAQEEEQYNEWQQGMLG
ncbi:MAG: hypothetical protein LUF29_00565 [Oscillospiraceae bacterium]|nr:hypothetical protein [Oscillospiraceae bacterium]